MGLRRGVGRRGRRAPGGWDRPPDPGGEPAASGATSERTSLHDLRPTHRRSARARRLGGPHPTGRSTSRSIPGWPRGRALERRRRARALSRSASADAAGGKGVYTHFHSADSDPASAACSGSGSRPCWRPCRAVPRWCMPPTARRRFAGAAYAGDLVRPGIFLYGGGRTGDAREPVARSGHGWWRCDRIGAGER